MLQEFSTGYAHVLWTPSMYDAGINFGYNQAVIEFYHQFFKTQICVVLILSLYCQCIQLKFTPPPTSIKPVVLTKVTKLNTFLYLVVLRMHLMLLFVWECDLHLLEQP